jgi:transposase
LGEERDPHLFDHLDGHGAVKVIIEGPSDGESFSLYLNEVLRPRLWPGRIVVMDNLCVHKNRRVRELIEERGCELWFLPAYSPDLNPIEEAFSKIKGALRKAKARSLDALFEATGEALRSITEEELAVSSRTAGTSSCGSTLYENCFSLVESCY